MSNIPSVDTKSPSSITTISFSSSTTTEPLLLRSSTLGASEFTKNTTATSNTSTSTVSAPAADEKENMGGSAFSKHSAAATPLNSNKNDGSDDARNNNHLTLPDTTMEKDTTTTGKKSNDKDRASPTSVMGDSWACSTPPKDVVHGDLGHLSPVVIKSTSSSSEQPSHSTLQQNGEGQNVAAAAAGEDMVQAITCRETLDELKQSVEKLTIVAPSNVDQQQQQQHVPVVENDSNQDVVAVARDDELAEKKKEIHDLRQFMERSFIKHHEEMQAWKAEKEQLVMAGVENTVQAVELVKEGYEKALVLHEKDAEALKQSLEAVEQEKKDLEGAVESAVALRAKTLANLKKKKDLLAQSEAQRTALRAKLEDAQTQKTQLESENASLRAGLNKVTSVKDEIKMKLRSKADLIKEARQEQEVLERKLAKIERERVMERELLEHYRKLSRHTGFFKWGKQIRNLESSLAASMEDSTNSSSNNETA